MALLAGAASGAGVALIISVIDLATEQLWGGPVEQALGQAPPLAWSVMVCGGFGWILSLIHRGGSSTLLPELPETMEDLRHPDRAPHRDERRALLGAALAQIGGGSIGPEALMTRLAALISRQIWRGKDHALQSASVAGSLGLFGAPLLGGMVVGERRQDALLRWVPGILGGVSGFAVFHGINEASGGSLKALPYVWPANVGESLSTLIAALLAAAIGCGLGIVFQRWRHWLEQRQLMAQWCWWPLVTGLLLGALMHWLPLVPFGGEDQMRPLLEHQQNHYAALLFISAFGKLLMLGLCLETGWRGGIFFPIFLIACAAGTGLHQLLPDLGSLGSWCGGLTGALYQILLPSPLVVIVLGLALLQGHGAGGLLVGVAVAHLIKQETTLGDVPPPHRQTPDSHECPMPQWSSNRPS
jgi:H+/Cl- antiporter ClcA